MCVGLVCSYVHFFVCEGERERERERECVCVYAFLERLFVCVVVRYVLWFSRDLL